MGAGRAETFMNYSKQIRTVFIFEDDPGYGSEYVQAYERAGWNVVWFTQPPDNVLDLAAEKRPDVIHLDINMPGMNGLELAELLRVHGRTSSIPLYFQSSMSGQSYREKARALGAIGYYVKGENSIELVIREIEHLLALMR